MFSKLKKVFFKGRQDERKILLYGLQRSGTNFLESLVRLNFPGCHFVNGEVRNAIDHKHFRLYDNKAIIPEPQFLNHGQFSSFAEFEKQLPEVPEVFLIMSKDPYSWLVSYNNWSRKNNWPKPHYHYIEEYNLFYGKWMEFSKSTNKILFIRYVDLLQQPLEELKKIAALLHLPDPEKLKTTKKVYASRKFTGSKKEAFLNNDHLQKISANDLNLINQKLDRQLLDFLGYDVV